MRGIAEDGTGEEDGDGIGKARAKAKKVLKRKQRIRLERGKERAESVGDKMERKKGLGKKGVGRGVSGFLFPSYLSVCPSVYLRKGPL